MGIIDLCGFANPLYDPVKAARLLSEKTEASEQLHSSKQPPSSAVLTKPTPACNTGEPSFGSWDDMKIPAIKSSAGESLKRIAKLTLQYMTCMLFAGSFLCVHT